MLGKERLYILLNQIVKELLHEDNGGQCGTKVSLAQMPFMAGLIERFISEEQPVDYSAYKTAIGETAENAYGKLTLNEVLVEADRLLFSSTFEPAKGVHFDYRTHLPPHVLVNGEDLQLLGGSQSVKVNAGGQEASSLMNRRITVLCMSEV